MYRLKNYKSKIAAFLTALLLALSLCVYVLGNLNGERICFADESAPATQTRIVGYLPDWSYQAYKKIDFSALTHINISFCNVGSRGEITCGIPDDEMQAIVEKAHANNVKVMAALGGGGYGDPYRDYISSFDKIKSLNDKIIAFCEKHGLDGVDLDIEIQSSDSIWNNYGEWVTELRSICDERGWLLSTATAQWVAGSVSPETFSLFDYINVMAYDNDSRGSDSHSSYAFAVECLNYFHTHKNIPKEKLVLGVPFYGRGYSDNGALDWNLYVSFSDLVKKDEANYDSDYADYYEGAAYPVAYTGASTMRDKCELAKEYGGIMIWEITLDAEGEFSLLGLIKEELLPASNVPDTHPIENSQNITLPWIILGVAAGAAVVAAATVAVVFIKKNKAKNK